MNGYERTMAALSGKPHDCVPVMLHNFMSASAEAKVSMGKFREDPRTMADVFIRATEKYQCDGIIVDMDTSTLAGSLGALVDFPEHEPARQIRGVLGSLDDVQKLKPVKTEDYKYVQIWLEAVRLLREHFGNEVLIRGNCDQAPFSLAALVRGMDEWMTDLCIAEPESVHALLSYCADATCQFVRLMAQAGAHMISNGDSIAGPDVVSPEFYNQFALPYEKKVVAEAHRFGLPYALHICGNTDLILESMIDTGADALELDYKTDIGKAYDLLHDKVTFIGNIDPVGVIATGTSQLVKEKTDELLGIFGKTNRFILNSGCALSPLTPTENIRILTESAKKFRYS